ncbi:MAG: T9SS type A sorting domain-containing protein, partial [candidate division Zixibacteria bacterium]|nr:T9SS type A sorting domain-containing protein [candidate division Zixibacteria bacterium]
FGSTGDEFATSVVETDDGGFIVSGGTSSFGAGSRDFYLVRTNSAGDTLWTRTYGGSNQEQSYSTRKTADGAYILAGQTSSFGAGGLDFWTVKIAELGYLGLIFEPDSFIFDVTGDTIITREFSVYSDGSTTHIRPRCDSSWVSFDPDSVYITHADTVTIEAVFDPYGLDFGVTYQTAIYFANSTPELNEAEIPVEMTTHAPIPITVEMIPDDPPIVVEPGDYFTYEGILNNNIGGPFPYPDEITVWINVEVRNIILGPIMRVDGIEVPPQGLHYPGVRQYVHSQAQPGEYGYIAYCSTEYPEIMDSCFFNFTVVDNVPLCYRDWETYGWGDNSLTVIDTEESLNISPNPFNSITSIDYRIINNGKVVIEIFNLLGQRVKKLLDKWQQSGAYSLRWDASIHASGIYFCRMTIGEKSVRSKLILMK